MKIVLTALIFLYTLILRHFLCVIILSVDMFFEALYIEMRLFGGSGVLSKHKIPYLSLWGV